MTEKEGENESEQPQPAEPEEVPKEEAEDDQIDEEDSEQIQNIVELENPPENEESSEAQNEIEGTETGEAQQKQDNVEEEEEEVVEEEQEMTQEELEELFNKNTVSFRCLAQILLSRSSLLRHPLYHFPPLKDPGIDAAFNYVEPEEPIDDICADKYKKLCKEMNIVPISRVINSLPTKDLNLRFYGLTTNQIKALARALNLNTHVEELNLEENFLTPEAAYYVEEMLRENNTLKVLNMKECHVGPLGAENLSEGILLTQSLQFLDLSHNDLGTRGMKSLMGAFKDSTIKRLNLSHNNLGDDAAVLLSNVLKENSAMEELDLSWNNLGTISAMKTFWDGMAHNECLRTLSLAWNGIMLAPAVKSMTTYLKKAEKLEFLDLSNNRIGGHSFKPFKSALGKNQSLRGVNLAYNPLTPDEAHALGELITSNKSPPNFQILDMDNVYVKKDFVPIMKKAMKMEKTIKIKGILGNWRIKGPNIPRLLFDRAQLLAMSPKKKKKKKDFSHFVFSLPDKPVKKTDFETLVKKFKAKKVDNDLMQEIMKLFPYKKNGVDPVAMKEKYHALYPDAQPAPPKKKKKHKRKHKRGAAKSETKIPDAAKAISTISTRLPSQTVAGGETVEKTQEEIPEGSQTLIKDSRENVSKTSQHDVNEGETDPNITTTEEAPAINPPSSIAVENVNENAEDKPPSSENANVKETQEEETKPQEEETKAEENQ